MDHGPASGGDATPSRPTAEELIDRFRTWATGAGDVRALAVVGSRARAHDHADAWSDLDLVLVADDADRYLADGDWLAEIGPCRLTFVEEAPVAGLHERRAHFEGGQAVDVVVVTPAMLAVAVGLPAVADLVARGWRVLVDKDELAGRLTSQAESGSLPSAAPTERELAEAAARFWHKAVWTARKLCRGELWVATTATNRDLHQLLLQALEWEAQTRPGDQPDVWFRGRFLERWADPQTVRRLPETFAGYDPAAVAHALRVLPDVYRRLTDTVARRIGCEPPRDAHAYGSEVVEAILGGRFPDDAP